MLKSRVSSNSLAISYLTMEKYNSPKESRKRLVPGSTKFVFFAPFPHLVTNNILTKQMNRHVIHPS